MSFLTPLYALGALAVALPILFHLIQRRPRGEQWFSSLMFLTSSTPRITRRSRLNNILLLLLRAAALMLLAAAFARPFLRTLQQFIAAAPERHVAILLDRSASMRRGALWEQAQAEVQKVLAGLGRNDRVALFSYDDRLQPVVGFDTPGADSSAGIQLIREQLTQLQPGWRATDLGHALVEVLEQLRATAATGSVGDESIVLITDLQQGSRLDTLQAATWPPDVRLDVRPLRAAEGNASLQWLPPDETDEPSQLRVRVSNDEQAKNDALQLIWETDTAVTEDTPAKSVQVPPGRSRVVSVARRAGPARLKLVGDAQLFDNVAYLGALQPIEKRVLFVGDARDEKDRQFFFLKRTALGSSEYPMRIEPHAGADTPSSLDPLDTPLVVLAQPTAPEWTSVLRGYLEQGGRVLVVMDPAEYAPGQPRPDTESLAALLDLQNLEAEVVQAESYAMLSQVDFQNPLFLPFAEAKFNDFTKIRIWRYHRLATNHEQPWRVLARYDDQSVALAESSVGTGYIWVLTTGWCPETSQLALSTKFVPLLISMLGSAIESDVKDRGLTVGQPIDLTRDAAFSQVLTPQGQTITLSAQQREYRETDEIGIYRFSGPARQWDVAMNLDPAESRTVPLDLAELEQRGVLLGAHETALDLDRRQRQMRDQELESRQKLWRWLVVAALSVLAVETYVAGRSSRLDSSANAGKD